MKLHRLRLENFKGVADRTVEFPDSGVIVLEGANEVGKTSMIEAFDLLIGEKDSARKASIRAIQPVGMDVGSAVEAELTSGRYRFTYRKQWLKKPSTVLEILQPRREHLVGDAAHDRVNQILDETMDRALWGALRFMQAAPLTQTELGDSTVLAAALDGAAGQSNDAGTEGDSLVAAAEQEYLRYFTRTGRESGDYRVATQALESARATAERAEADLAQVTQDVDRHAGVSSDLTRLKEREGSAAEELADLRAQWEVASVLQARADEAEHDVEVAQRELERAESDQVTRATFVRELTDRTAELTERSSEAEALLESMTPLTRALEQATEDHREAEAEEERSRAVADLGQTDVRHLRERRELTELTSRLRRLDELARARSAARARLGRCRVDAELLSRVEDADQTLRVALATQRAGSALLRVEALADGQPLEIAGQPVALAAGESSERPVTECLQVLVPGALKVTVQPESGAQALADDVASARRTLQELLREAGATDVGEARSAYEDRSDAERAVQRAEDQWEDQIGNDELADLQDHIRLLTASTQCYLEDRDTDLPLPEDTRQAEQVAAAAELAHRRARDAAREANARLAGINEELSRQEREVTRVQSALDATQGRLQVDEARLALIREQASDEALELRVEEAQTVLSQAMATRAAVTQQLEAQDPESLKARLDNATQVVDRLARQVQELHEEQISITSRLELTGSQGRQEKLDAAQTALEAAKRHHHAVQRRALAAQLLFRTLERRRDEAKRAYVAPFTREVAKLGRIVYGPDFEVSVNERLCLESRTLAGRTIPFDQLSGGAREQLGIITRLAVASLVDADHGVPVVIDDALGYSDPERLQRIGAIFGGPAEGSQVILLTCTPERYSSIGAAEVIRLDREPVDVGP